MGEIFLDVYMIVNFTLNYALLYATAVAAGRRTTAARLASASAVGSIYALGYLYPPLMYLYGYVGILSAAAVMVILAFHPLRGGRDAVLLIPFLGLAISGGGMGLLLMTGADGRGAAGPVSVVQLGGIAVFILVSGYAIYRTRTSNNLSSDLLTEVTVQIDGCSVTCRGLVDTGNRVVDPVSGDPVIIIEYPVMREVLPLSWKKMTASLEGAIPRNGAIAFGGWDRRLRVLPFRALQGSGGIMLGMKPDAVVIHGTAEVRVTNVVVGVTREVLSSSGEYRALIPACFS